MKLPYLLFSFTLILSCIAQNWDENFEYFPQEEEFLIEEEYINGEGLLILDDAEVSFSIFSDIGNWVKDKAKDIFDDSSDSSDSKGSTPETHEPPKTPVAPETPETYEPPKTPVVPEAPETYEPPKTPEAPKPPETYEPPKTPQVPVVPEVIDIVSPITWNSTLEGYVITAYREESVIVDEPGSRMSTNVTLVISGYYAGRITAETKVWTETANWGFMGEVYVELLGENNVTIGTTGNHTVGVNGEMLDPTDGYGFWEEWLQVSWAELTVSIRIVQTQTYYEGSPAEEETQNGIYPGGESGAGEETQNGNYPGEETQNGKYPGKA